MGFPSINNWPFSFVSKGQSIFSVTQIMMTLDSEAKKSSVQSLPDPEEGKQNVLCYCSCSPNSQLLGEWCCCTGCCRATTTMTEMEKYRSTIRFVSRLSIFKIYE